METIAEEQDRDVVLGTSPKILDPIDVNEDDVDDDKPARELFAFCDRERKGFLIVDDLYRLCDEFGLTKDQIGVVFSHLDNDNDGRLTAAEFHEGLQLFLKQSKSSKYVLQRFDLPSDDTGNCDHFCSKNATTISRCGSVSEVLGLLRDNETGLQFWNFIQAEHPELIPYLEDFLRVLANEHKKIKDETLALQECFDKKSMSYVSQIRALYEEMETQIQNEKAKIMLKEAKLEKQLRHELQEAINVKEHDMQDILEKWFMTEKELQAMRKSKITTTKENKRLLQEKEAMQRDLEVCHRKMMELRMELELAMEENQLTERRQIYTQESTRELSEKIAWERMALDKQLSLLKSINERLAMDRDELAGSSVLKDLLDLKTIGTTWADDTKQSSRLNFKRGSIVANYFGRSPTSLKNNISQEVDDDEVFIDTLANHAADDNGEVPQPPPTTTTCLVQPNNHQTFTPYNSMVQLMFKVVFVGDSSVGKTSLINRICNRPFADNIGTTIGVDFHTRSVICDDSEVLLQLWDTAGQERFRSITRQYMRRSDAVLVVYDVTSEISFSNVSGWMSSLDVIRDDNALVILIGNKVDAERRILSRKHGEKLAEDIGAAFFETSAKNGDGIFELILMLANTLKKNQKEMQTKSINLSENNTSTMAKKAKASCC